MSDYEILSVVLMMLSIVVTLILALINAKKVTAIITFPWRLLF